MIKLEHLRVVFGGDDLRRLAVDHLYHPFVVQQQLHRERGGLIPQQPLVASDQHPALGSQRLRQILNRPGLIEVGADNRLFGKALLQIVERQSAHERADDQRQQRQESHGVTPIRSNKISGLTKHISRLFSSTATWMV